MIQQAIKKVVEHESLSRREASEVFQLIMAGEATPAQIAALLIGLRLKGETVEEIVGAAQAMRAVATPVHVHLPHLVDTCGTGGDSAHTFNISTAAAFVAAAGGAAVAKHGNRSVSSKSGSADVLEAAGVRLALTPEQVKRCIEEVGIGFLYAPAHHGAMRHAIGPRREIGVRTIFNLLGPLTNPAGAPNQVVGVYAERWLTPLAEVLRELGSRHVLAVHGADGLDEISISGPTEIAELRDGQILRDRIEPEDFGLKRAPIEALRVADARESLAVLLAVLRGEPGPHRDVVLLNAGAALYVAGLSDSLQAGVAQAEATVDSGAALVRLNTLTHWTNAVPA
ncbi:MAG: anthranilate phosphoribosyltransferase [Pseudomonadota bacterium]|uniref:anthranilate phosphoribosyltransferase n=1 Tax=Thermithiobacillus tepidarius TaxID=929 RepID=UPI00041858A3|nr:anthranilate phosphoribosyltransferase [Thermithiobacillus tepidarius]